MKQRVFATFLFSIVLASGFALAADQDEASDFTLTSLDGRSVSLQDYRHRKVVVMNFWAAWCDSCEEEMPKLLKLKSQYDSQDVVFLGINAGDTERAAQKFVDKTGYSYVILLDKDKSVARKFQVLGIPQTLVISKDGKIVYREGRPPPDLHFVDTSPSHGR